MYRNSNSNWLPSLFNDILNDWTPAVITNGSAVRTAPAFNVIENENNYQVEVAAPGMTKDDFNVSISDGDIIIAMEKKNDAKDEDKEKKYIRREFSYGKYEQRLTLPDNVEKQNITAQMTDGVLCIDIPKMTPDEKAKECQCIEIK
jgi:HSP20 family protein